MRKPVDIMMAQDDAGIPDMDQLHVPKPELKEINITIVESSLEDVTANRMDIVRWFATKLSEGQPELQVSDIIALEAVIELINFLNVRSYVIIPHNLLTPEWQLTLDKLKLNYTIEGEPTPDPVKPRRPFVSVNDHGGELKTRSGEDVDL